MRVLLATLCLFAGLTAIWRGVQDVQVHGAVFGHHPVDVAARRDDAGARSELRDDAIVLPEAPRASAGEP